MQCNLAQLYRSFSALTIRVQNLTEGTLSITFSMQSFFPFFDFSLFRHSFFAIFLCAKVGLKSTLLACFCDLGK